MWSLCQLASHFCSVILPLSSITTASKLTWLERYDVFKVDGMVADEEDVFGEGISGKSKNFGSGGVLINEVAEFVPQVALGLYGLIDF